MGQYQSKIPTNPIIIEVNRDELIHDVYGSSPVATPGSRTTFDKHLENTGPVIKVTRPITCDTLKTIPELNKYDTDMICRELSTVSPCQIDELLLHNSTTGLVRIVNTTRDNNLVVNVQV